MGFDGFNFSTKHLREKHYDDPVAVICDCGKVTVDHTMRERRSCEQDAV